MNENRETKLIYLYNIYTAFLCPAVFFLSVLWSMETDSRLAKSKLPLVILLVFVPEVVFGLEWKMGKRFSIVCSTIWVFLLFKVVQYYFLSKTSAPNTFLFTMLFILTGFLFSILMELNQNLREHIITYPKAQWLVPHSSNPAMNTICWTIWIVGVVIGAIFLFVT